MSRAQETTATNTAASQNAGYYNNSQNSYSNAETDAGNYEKQLSEYAGSNPYTAGGEFQTAQNTSLSNTADASAAAAGTTLQSQALRTGQNTSGDVAATEAMQQSNERALSGQEATENASRISSEAGYNQGVLSATAVPVQQQTTLAANETSGATGAASNQGKDAETPSWMDQFGSAVASGLGKAITSGGK